MRCFGNHIAIGPGSDAGLFFSLYYAVQDLSKKIEANIGDVSNINKRVAILTHWFITYVMQEKYSDKNFEITLKMMCISDEAINIINNLYEDGRRSYVSRDNEGRSSH